MRGLATNPAARGLMDDAAVLDRPEGALVLTHDMLVEGVHFLPEDPPETVAWKLCAVNMSDLNAKGATPLAILIGYGMTNDRAWDTRFAEGLGKALNHFGAPLLGGDTVRMPAGGPRTLGLTALGAAPATGAPSRMGARPGDLLLATGSIGDAGAGLAVLQGRKDAPENVRALLVAAYRQPRPPVTLGPVLAPLVTAMADISDGLLIDANRIAQASGVTLHLDLAEIPLSHAFVTTYGDGVESRFTAATAGDDYQLLFTASPDHLPAIRRLCSERNIAIAVVGHCDAGAADLRLVHAGAAVPLPDRLGYEHGK